MEQRQPKLRYPLIPESFLWGLLLGVLLVFVPGPLFPPPIAAAATLIAPSATEYAALDGLAAAIAAVGILLILGAILVVKTVRARRPPRQGQSEAQDAAAINGAGDGVLERDAEDMKSLQLAAGQGNATAQHKLAGRYRLGWDVPEDEAEAVRWYRRAAAQGHAAAQETLGWCYEFGFGISQDLSAAVTWYRRAAAQGHANAQVNLGWCYEFGKGVPENLPEAVTWYCLATEHGKGSWHLARCYEFGKGVAQNFPEADKWYRRAHGPRGSFRPLLRAVTAKDRIPKGDNA